MIDLHGKKGLASLHNEKGLTLLELSLKHHVDWGFSCVRGTCARCRCLVTEGMEQLAAPSDMEEQRLEPEELAQGYRLSCQTVIIGDGDVKVKHKPYF